MCPHLLDQQSESPKPSAHRSITQQLLAIIKSFNAGPKTVLNLISHICAYPILWGEWLRCGDVIKMLFGIGVGIT